MNGDGYDDLLIGAPHANGAIADVGVAALYFGAANGLGATADWTAEGDQATARFGVSVAGIGDLDGDGFEGVEIGADRAVHGKAEEGRG